MFIVYFEDNFVIGDTVLMNYQLGESRFYNKLEIRSAVNNFLTEKFSKMNYFSSHKEGDIVGTLCIFDTKTKKIEKKEIYFVTKPSFEIQNF